VFELGAGDASLCFDLVFVAATADAIKKVNKQFLFCPPGTLSTKISRDLK